jgi:2-polyprenyl-3-methyl-5-hydroxy-6-metoxy-1,4-benzoquinol methylase
VDTRFEFKPFNVVACRNCELVFLSPRLTEESIFKLYQDRSYYQSSVSGQGYDEYMNVRENWHKTFDRRLRIIQEFKPEGRILDVGCGPGFFMEVAERKGYDVWGLDPSSYIVGVAQERFGARVRKGTLETAAFENQSFDVIVSFDTFEHIYKPLTFLDASRELLASKGILVITTPNTMSLLARITGRRWVSFKIPEHVFYWSPSTISEAMRGRFRVLRIKNAGQYATLSFLVRRLFRLRSEATGLLRKALVLLSKISIYSDNGSITVVAEKID